MWSWAHDLMGVSVCVCDLQAFRLFNEDGGEGDASITKEEFR